MQKAEKMEIKTKMILIFLKKKIIITDAFY